MAPGPVASVLHTPASPTWMDSSYTRRLLRTLSPGPFCERLAESWTAGVLSSGCSSSGAVASARQVLVWQAQGPEFRSSAHISKLDVVAYAGNPIAGQGTDRILGD